MEGAIEEASGWSKMVVAAIVTLAVLSLTYLTLGKAFRKRRYPPGPRGWPVFGSLLSLGNLPHRSLDQLSKQYGPLMMIYLGSVPTVVVSNSQMAEVILKTKDHIMASRPDFVIAHKVFYDASMAFAPYGPYWRYLRKICATEIFAANRINQFQAMRQREVLAMLHSILERSQHGNVVTVNEFLSNLMTNNITQMMLNKSYCSGKGDLVSTEARAFRDVVREMYDMMGVFNLADYIPILKSFDLQGYNKQYDALHQKVDTFLETVLVEYRNRSLTEKQDGAKNFVDVLLAISERGEAESEEHLSRDAIKSNVTEMINGGTETVATTVEWALAELLRHPSMLRRAQEELDLVVGKHRLVDEADIPQLKYIQAVVKEVFRLHPPAPLLVPHESMEDCEIEGYHVPARCRVLVNAWSIQRDPLVWERCLEFDPGRFLDSSGTIDVKGTNFELLPFGSGRRMCPAINLGLLLVEYTLAQMLHTISWALPQHQTPEDLDMLEFSGLVCPKAIPLDVLAKPRLPGHVIYLTKSV